jgi:hypothetical protein
MAPTFVVIAFAGVLMLPHVKGPVWLRWLGRVLAGALAFALSWATLSLYQLGAERNWTGDGPGMLVVMLLIPVAALCALAAWLGTLWPSGFRSGRLSVPPWIAIGMIVVGLAGSTKSADDYRRELRHAHEAPVVALQLTEAGTRLVSIDGAGTVMRWKVPERALMDVRTFDGWRGLAGC